MLLIPGDGWGLFLNCDSNAREYFVSSLLYRDGEIFWTKSKLTSSPDPLVLRSYSSKKSTLTLVVYNPTLSEIVAPVIKLAILSPNSVVVLIALVTNKSLSYLKSEPKPSPVFNAGLLPRTHWPLSLPPLMSIKSLFNSVLDTNELELE